MPDHLLDLAMQKFLEQNEFIYLATCDTAGRPYVVPKFLICADEDGIYLADFVFGRTIDNILAWPRASFSVMDMDTLKGYQMNGSARVLEQGDEYQKVAKQLSKRQMHYCVERIIQGVQHGKKHNNFEAAFPEKFAVLRIEVEEIVEIAPEGRVDKKRREAFGS